jgi:pyridoxal phosphate enzyme (YggS family)
MGSTIAEALRGIEERIGAACLRSGRKETEIRLMGVSKFQPLDALVAAWDAGIRLFGESRVQEAAEKFTAFRETRAFDSAAELHLIGALQRNKAKRAALFFDCVQSVDREELVDELGKAAQARERPLAVLLEMRTGEETKTGFPDVKALCRGAERALSYPSLRLCGLMTMAPYTDEERLVRQSFQKARDARDALERRFPEGCWSCLSMGMSNDFEIAIEEGATLLRIGTALFNPPPRSR